MTSLTVIVKTSSQLAESIDNRSDFVTDRADTILRRRAITSVAAAVAAAQLKTN